MGRQEKRSPLSQFKRMENKTIKRIKVGDLVMYNADCGGRTMLAITVPAQVVGLTDEAINCFVPMLEKTMSFDRESGISLEGRQEGFIEAL